MERSEVVLTIFVIVLVDKRTVHNIVQAVKTASDRFELSAAHPLKIFEKDCHDEVTIPVHICEMVPSTLKLNINSKISMFIQAGQYL